VDTVNFAARLATSREVFIVMSFKTSAAYKDLKRAIEVACKQHGFLARRVDESNDTRRIIPEIIRGIRHSAFVVADLTEERPNVYWEMGLAAGMDKAIIAVAKAGTILPFDVNDVPVIFWESFAEFEEKLAKCIERLALQRRR
jgi:nucleoside 2-deoxyribosyltransferase